MAKRDAQGKPKFKEIVGVDSWVKSLRELDGIILERLRRSEQKIERYRSIYPSAVALLKIGTMLREPATAQEILELEGRTGVTLPPTYRAFLKASNGLNLPVHGQFLSTRDVQSYSQIDPMGAGLMEEFAEDFEEDFPEPSDEEYFQYSSPEMAQLTRPRYAKTALALNGPDGEMSHVGKAMGWALLVREVRFANGEHEIWQQAFEWQFRFNSFAEYFSAIRQTIFESVDSM
jgi:hypothetical protein